MVDFTAILSREFRWPTVGDKPFVEAARWQDNAYIDPRGRGRIVMMMTGYRLGSELMVRQAVESDFDRHALVFPIIFNYRQFLELSLKYLIGTYGRAVGVKSNWKTHSLTVLWEIFMEVLDGYGAREPDGAAEAVAVIVGEFAKVDPGSFSYRYPVDTKGMPISLAHEQLDLAALADVMTGVNGYFSGCDGYLDNLQSAGL
jgi:hypothetical protein